MKMFFEILTLFPSMFNDVFNDSIIKRAIERGLISISIDNIRNYAQDAHKSVDDYPYGGDPGMLLKPEPLSRAIEAAKGRLSHCCPKVIFLSPHGEVLKHEVVDELVKEEGLILICGRYKGIDHRINEKYVDREISMGDYILSGGEIPAMVLVDAITRLIPGVLGNKDSAGCDSFFNGLLSPPEYTRPEVFEGIRVPEVLLKGHHQKIKEWQRINAENRTKQSRPDLWAKYITKKNKTENNKVR